VDPRTRPIADRLLHDVDKGSHVVIGDCLAFENRLDERLVDVGRTLAACHRGIGRRDTDRGVRLGRQQLDFEPAPETSYVRPHGGHLRRAVPGDHDVTTPRSCRARIVAVIPTVTPSRTNNHRVPRRHR
jgi:hypothetical protein